MATSDEWRMPTLADTGVTKVTRCRCSRPKLPDELYDVAGIPAAKGAPYLCAECLGDLYRSDKLDRVELHRAKGAPVVWLERFEADLLETSSVLRPGLPQHVWGEILARALDVQAVKLAAREAAAAAKAAQSPPS